MAFRDLREFIAKLVETGDIQAIDQEVDWNLEAGAIMRRCNELGTPAPFFKNIKGYMGHRIFGSPLATFRRLAVAFEVAPDTPMAKLMGIYNERNNKLLKPILVPSGPCKENIVLGDDIDLLKFPVPLIHEGDGGRYIGTWHSVSTKDPDSSWVNWGMYRVMVHDRNTIACMMTSQQHIGHILAKYEAKGEPMEVAIAIGPEPITTFIAARMVPFGVSEVDVIGGFRGEPLEVVRCETVDLVVPATAEIIIEGKVLPNARKDEGPFGEYVGYQAEGVSPKPVITVTAITHRHDPILTASNMGYPVDDCDVVQVVGSGAELKADLLRAGFPITGISIPMESSYNMCVVATKTPYSHIANQIASFIWGSSMGRAFPKIIIVNEDVDPTDMKQVIFAFATKCHPEKGITIIKNMPASPLKPFLSKEERTYLKGSNVVFDCTWPLDWRKENIPRLASFDSIYPEEIRKKVLTKWQEYGFR